MALALRLPGERMTAIIKMKVDELLDHFEERAHSVFPDNIFPGTSDAPPSARLAAYLASIEDIGDIALLSDPDYLDKYKLGQVPPPKSPYWVTALSVPPTFEKMRADFFRLLEREK